MQSLVLVLLVAVPVVFDPREGQAGGRPRYLLVLWAAAGATVLIGGAMAGGNGWSRRAWRENPLRWPVLALVFWSVLASVISDHRVTALHGFPGTYDGLLLTVALAAIFFATAITFRPELVRRAVEVAWFGAGGLVLLFGAAQLLDQLLAPNRGWDWARPAIAPNTIGSTLGNPNYLAGFLAVLLPLGTVVACAATGRKQAAAIVLAGVALVELVVTASRGGWIGAAAGMVTVGLLLRKRFLAERRRRVVAISTAGAAVLVALLLGLGAAGVTKVEPAAILRSGPGSTVDQRRQIWATAARVTADHPVFGVGPDVFPVVFPDYATDRFRLLFGPFTVANGAHNVFLNTSANLGVGGLVALLWLLAATVAGAVRGWRGVTADHGDPDARLLLAGISGALVAFVAQACFGPQAVALSCFFWVLLGLLVGLLQPDPRSGYRSDGSPPGEVRQP